MNSKVTGEGGEDDEKVQKNQDSIGLQIGIPPSPPLSKFYETPGFLGLMTETTGSVAAVFFHDIICNHDQHIIFNCFL